MKDMLLTITVLTLLMGVSGCLYRGPGGWEWRQDRYQRGGQGYDRGGQGNPFGRDCFSRDSHWYCRDGN